MVIEPLGTRVLIRPLEQETTTKSGLILPETAKEKPQQGRIEAIGNSEEMLTGLQVGDVTLFAKYSGNEIEVDGVKYIIMEEGDVLARIKTE
ncbi:MAG: co-chaperone GroES [Anaerolinea sp.]|nr:co-chaperone GroES [Anaerolinea sp.]